MNMRKIIALLAAVLMLCAAIPMGVMSVTAAPGDVIIDADFNDGMDGFTNHSVIDGALVIDGTSADWANSFIYAGFKPGVKYQVTFSAKADAPQTLSFKINNGWNGTNVSEGAALTTEYAEYELFLTPDANLVEPIFTIQTNTVAANGTIFYIDWVKVVEYKEPAVPGTVINGDFETGDATGWNLPQQGSVKAEAAHDGSYGINVKGNGSYGGLLDQTISVEAGKSYDISFWLKVNANGINYQIKDGDTSGANLASDWVDMNKAGEWKYFTATVTPTTDLLTINFCGAGNSTAEDVYIDSITCAESIDAVWHTNFNDGEAKFNNGEIVAAGPDGSSCFKWSANGGWSATYVVIHGMDPSKDYTLTMKAKASVAGNMGVTIQNGDWGSYWNAPAFAVTTEWTDIVYTIPANSIPFTAGAILFKFQDTGVAMDLYVDDMVLVEGQPEAGTNLIANGDFEIGAIAPWDNLWGSNSVEMVAGYNSDYAMKITAGSAWTHVRQTGIAVKPNTDYTITLYAKDSSGYTLLIKDGADSGNVAQAGLNAGAEWTPVTFTFNTGDNSTILFSFMSNNAGDTCTVDDVVLFEGVPEKPVKELTNGDFEAGELGDWINLWGSNTVTFVEGYEGNYAMSMVVPADKQWSQVRQDDITVKPNTDYRLTAYVKGAQNMAFVIKKGGDAGDMTSHNDCIFPAGEDWQKVSLVFNTADQTAICILIINYEKGGSVIIDNITLEEVVPCEHEYYDDCDTTCDLCGEVRVAPHGFFYACDETCLCGEVINPTAGHHIEHVAAKAPGNCVEFGNKEYWYCTDCGHAWLDEDLYRLTNLKAVMIAGQCVSDAEFPCQTGICTGCGLEVTPDVAHTYDNDYDASCNVCGDIREVEAPEILYGDVNGDGQVTITDEALVSQYLSGWEVTLNEAAADVNGDGQITITDEALISQYLSGWDVTLGG